MSYQKPPKLQSGDKISIVAPSGKFYREKMLKGIEAIQSAGFVPVYQEDIFEVDGLCAGTDERRFNELRDAFASTETKAVLCARGGYGSTRLLSRLRKEFFTKNRKIFVGYSDLTSLLSYLLLECAQTVVHGPVVVESEALSQLWPLLTEVKSHQLEIDGEVLFSGEATGVILGGNLSILQSLAGLPWFLGQQKCILVIEDVKEPKHRIDRILVHLRQLGLFDNIVGLVIGKLGSDDDAWESQIVRQHFSDLKVPTLYDCGIGHHKPKLAIPFGVSGRLNVDTKTLEVESVVQ